MIRRCPLTASVENARLLGAGQVLGKLLQTANVPLPRRARMKGRRLLHQAKRVIRGMPELLQFLLEVGTTLKTFRMKAWKQKIRRLCGPTVDDGCSRLVETLRRTSLLQLKPSALLIKKLRQVSENCTAVTKCVVLTGSQQLRLWKRHPTFPPCSSPAKHRTRWPTAKPFSCAAGCV